MTNRSQRKGNRAEVAVVNWLRNFRGFAAERIRSGRSTDAGDITWPGNEWLMDVKNQARWHVPAWWRAIRAEATTEGAKPILVLKLDGETDPGRWLAVLELRDVEL